MRVLIVEDDRHLADVLRRGLEEDGHDVDLCERGDEVLFQAGTASYDAIILDVMLPGRSGMDACRELRRNGIGTPVLMLTARDTVDDVVEGLETGADDYLTKPFAFRELRARLQSIVRRSAAGPPATMAVGDLVLDHARREVRRAGERIPLTNREYQVLAFLMQNVDRILTRMMIEDHVWGSLYAGYSNTVDVHIKRLRQKLDLPGRPSIIETVRGAGYRMKDPAR